MTMAARKTEKTGTTDPCPKCGGYGLIVGEDGGVRRCDCGLWEDKQLGFALERARIPNRFLGKTMESFKVPKGDGERREIKKIAGSYAQAFTPDEQHGLLLRGGTGTGKTHVATAILHEILRNGFSGLYCNVTDLMARLRASYDRHSSDNEEAILEELVETDLLVLDDLGAEIPTAWVRDRLYLVINRRYEAARATIVTTNCDDGELRERIGDKMGERVVSRLHEMCEIVVFPEGDYRFLEGGFSGTKKRG